MVAPHSFAVKQNDSALSDSGAAIPEIRSLPHVTILMCTYNGERFLAQQLDSIARQTYPNWNVLISDDGSTDMTLEILRQYAESWGGEKLTVHEGPRKGFAANFMSLTCRAQSSHYYAWADQDDVWHDNKLETALSALQRESSDVPLLYSTRTELIDESGTIIGLSPVFSRPTSFANALVQSIGGGNTMVFNSATHALFRLGGAQLDIVAHDWWAYIVVTGAGGKVFHDMSPSISYRQHEANIIGSNSDMRARLVRLRMTFSGRFRSWNSRNIAALDSIQSSLSLDSKVTLEYFKKARRSRGLNRFLSLWRAGVYRQTHWGNLGLILAAVFNKI